MSTLRRLVAIVSGATLGLINLASVAQADAPEQRVETIPFAQPVWADCAELGGGGIISATGTITRRVQVRADDDGTIRETRHVHFTGTLTGPSGTATYEGSFRAFFQDPEGLFIRTGQSKFHLPGRTTPLVMAGRQVWVGDELEMVTPRGGPAYSQAAVCEAIG